MVRPRTPACRVPCRHSPTRGAEHLPDGLCPRDWWASGDNGLGDRGWWRRTHPL